MAHFDHDSLCGYQITSLKGEGIVYHYYHVRRKYTYLIMKLLFSDNYVLEYFEVSIYYERIISQLN